MTTTTSKATIRRTGDHTVTRILPEDHPLNMQPEGAVVEVYWCPPGGGYVRLGDDATARQVCAGLSSRGYTLESTPEGLLDLIRREHARELQEWRSENSH